MSLNKEIQPEAAGEVKGVTWGRGHVYPRSDGVLARCGGPAICAECAKDRAQMLAEGPPHTVSGCADDPELEKERAKEVQARKIFLVKRLSAHNWDEFDSFVCVAPDAETARRMQPGDGNFYDPAARTSGEWVPPGDTVAEEIGVAHPNQPRCVVCASYNAG